LIPSTLASLAVFAFLLLPGYTFVRRRQHDLPSHEVSALNELALLIFVGLIIDVVVLTGFLGLRAVVPELPPDMDRLLAQPASYARQHFTEILVIAVILLSLATLLAYLASTPRVRTAVAKRSGGPPQGHQSAWWLLFNEKHPDLSKYVFCVLDDGTLIRGTLFSFSRLSRETGEREVVLTQPLGYRPAGDYETNKLPGVAAVSVSSRRITLMMVSYLDDGAKSQTSDQPRPVPSKQAHDKADGGAN
jgi:Family of unknown function (DUF6338)